MNKMKEIRLKKGLSLKDASKLLGVSSAYLSQIENGYRQLSRNMLKTFCEKYNVKPNEILEYDDFDLRKEITSFPLLEILKFANIPSCACPLQNTVKYSCGPIEEFAGNTHLISFSLSLNP